MNKNLIKIDELAEIHKLNGNHQNKKLNMKIKKEIKEKEKIINPKYIFEKTPKHNKPKSAMRKPTELQQNKKKPIIEYNY
jgi:hypothetical protein